LFLTSLLLSKKYRVSIAVKKVERSKWIHRVLSDRQFILIYYHLMYSSILILHLMLNFSSYIFISIQSLKRYLVALLIGMRGPLTNGLLLLLLLIISHILVRIHLKAISFFYNNK
jgi:hypothetical protein